MLHWQVDTDDTVSPPHQTQYMWAPIEVKSPALGFTPENLKGVENALKLLTEMYITDVNDSAGLHVHILAGLESTFRLQTSQNLFAFLFAFEPQIDTLHPAHRQSNDQFCKSLRRSSTFVDE